MQNSEIVLEPEQEQAIKHKKGHLRIIACPGSGKTETVSRRIVELIKDGVNPSTIVAFTFTRKAAENLVPLVEDNAWFFDTELLLLAGNAGYAIKEIPVHWEDDPDTRVRIISTAWEDIKGLLRLRLRGRPTPPLVS